MVRTSLLIFLFLLLLLQNSFAHKISAFVDTEGNKTRLMAYFSDGTPAKSAKVKIYDAFGKLVKTGKTDQNGEFTFTLKKPGKYRAVVTAELGHRASTTFSTEKPGNPNPARKEQTRTEENGSRISYKDVFGGIGWILGIFGASSLIYCRRRSGSGSFKE